MRSEKNATLAISSDVHCLRKGEVADSCMVSVIMSVYQSIDYLEEALNSVRNQNLSGFEIICIDDGSTDGSTEMLLDFSEKDERISVYQQPHLGLADARNVGLKVAVGKYLYFMDSDDILLPSALEKMTATAEERDLDVLCFEADRFYDSTCTEKELRFKPIYKRSHFYPDCTDGESLFCEFCENKEYYVPLWLMLCKRSLIVRDNLYFYSGIIHGDNVFFYSVIIRAKKAGYLKEVLYNRRIRPGSIMTSGNWLRSSYSYSIASNLLWEDYMQYKSTMSENARKWSVERMNFLLQRSIDLYYKALTENDEEIDVLNDQNSPFDKLIVQRVKMKIKYENEIRRKEEALRNKERELNEITNSRLYRILCRIRGIYRLLITNK